MVRVRVKEKKRREEKKKEDQKNKVSEERRSRCAKRWESRETLRFSNDLWLRGSKSRLAKAAGAVPAGQMRDEKLHAVAARSTFASEKAQSTSRLEHFFPRASERRVLPIVGICISSSHLHIFSSSNLLIFTSSHLHIF